MPFYPQVPSSGGVTFPVTVAQGGTGETTAAAALTALGGTTLAAVPGRLLAAPTYYAPASVAVSTCSSTSAFTAFDTTNIVSPVFTAPASGEVVVVVRFNGQVPATATSGCACAFSLAQHLSVTPLTDAINVRDSATAVTRPYELVFTVSGLSGSNQFDLIAEVEGTIPSFSIVAIGNQVADNTNYAGPVFIGVYAV
jgi:hypothetical protein